MAVPTSQHGKQPQDVDSEESGTRMVANSAAALVMADLVTRTGSRLVRHFVERKILTGPLDKKADKVAMKNRALADKLMAAGAAKIATKSVPGAAVVGVGLLVRTIYRRGKVKRDLRLQAAPQAAAPDLD